MRQAAGRRRRPSGFGGGFPRQNNLSVVISYDHAEKFQAAGIDNPAEHYKDKTIRVTGKVIEEDDQIRIRVEDPKKIEVVETK